ncbi:MAG TPA: hypothetical protein VF021_11175 [Longimicrobiales bacterium]
MNPYKNVVALTADLIFAARVRAAAQAENVSVILAKDVADFLTKISQLQPELAILDLDRRGLDAADVVQRVKAQQVALLAYASHVRVEAIEQARAAGADRVLARGAFAKQLNEILRAV